MSLGELTNKKSAPVQVGHLVLPLRETGYNGTNYV